MAIRFEFAQQKTHHAGGMSRHSIWLGLVQAGREISLLPMAVPVRVPEGAPAQLIDFLREKPGSTLIDATRELGLSQATAYQGLKRLRDLHLIVRAGRYSPKRWKVSSRTQILRRGTTFTRGTAAARPTGTLLEHAGGLQVIVIEGQQGEGTGDGEMSEEEEVSIQPTLPPPGAEL